MKNLISTDTNSDLQINGRITTNPDLVIGFARLSGGGLSISSHGNIHPTAAGPWVLGNPNNPCNAYYSQEGYFIISDRRLKKNIKSIEYDLKEVLEMKALNYQLIEDKYNETKLGIIVQNVEDILPEGIENYINSADPDNLSNTIHKTSDFLSINK